MRTRDLALAYAESLQKLKDLEKLMQDLADSYAEQKRLYKEIGKVGTELAHNNTVTY